MGMRRSPLEQNRCQPWPDQADRRIIADFVWRISQWEWVTPGLVSSLLLHHQRGSDILHTPTHAE